MSLTRAKPLLHLQAATLATSIGDDFLTSVSAFAALRKHFWNVELDGNKIVTAPARDIGGQLRGQSRLLALMSAVWAPMARQLQALTPVPTLCLLALPSWVSDTTQSATDGKSGAQGAVGGVPDSTATNSALQNIVYAFNAHCQRFKLDARVVAFTGGTETSHVALDYAFRALDTERPPERLVLLAADTLCDPDVLQRDYRAGRLYGREQSSGWVPGEAAACVHFTPTASVREVPKHGFALHAPVISEEPRQAPRWPSEFQGDGKLLHQALHGALQAAGMRPQHVSHHVSDNDGSGWRMEDEDAATSRLLTHKEDRWDCLAIQPASLLGQIGAAWGAVNWALASGLHQHDLARLNTAMCSTQDISGRCSANVMERSPC